MVQFLMNKIFFFFTFIYFKSGMDCPPSLKRNRYHHGERMYSSSKYWTFAIDCMNSLLTRDQRTNQMKVNLSIFWFIRHHHHQILFYQFLLPFVPSKIRAIQVQGWDRYNIALTESSHLPQFFLEQVRIGGEILPLFYLQTYGGRALFWFLFKGSLCSTQK